MNYVPNFMWMESDFAWILREFFTWFYVNLNTHRFVLILMRMSWWIGRLFFSQTILGLGDPEILHFILSLPPENGKKNYVNSEWFRVILGWIYVNLPWDTESWLAIPDTLGLLTEKKIRKFIFTKKILEIWKNSVN